MPEIIVKGADTSDAMDKVQKLLGPDAMILKTRKNGNYIEITATDEPMAPRQQSPSKNAIFSKMLQANLDAQKAEQHEAALKPNLTALDLKRARGIVPDTPEQAATTTAPQTQTQTPLERRASNAFTGELINVTESNRILKAGHIVLCGSQGAGKSLVALQIAAQGMAADPNFRPRLIYVGNGSRADAAYLRDKAQLIGVPLLFRPIEEVSQMARTSDQDIIVISGVGSTKFDDLRTLNAENLILVMPCHLRARAAEKRLQMLDGMVSGVILSHCDEDTPDADLIHTLEKANVILVRQSSARSMINTLTEVTHLDLNDWTGAKSAPSAQPSTSADPKTAEQPLSALPSLFRKRWSDTKASASPTDVVVPLLSTRKEAGSKDPQHQEGHS